MNNFSVLLIDDDEMTCDMFQMVMDHHHLHLSVLHDAESALMFLKNETPDVMVIDLLLPGMDGYLALQAIRKQGLADTTPIVATTAYHTLDTRSDVLRWGFAGYLPKPLEPSTLATTLQAVASENR